MENYSWRSVHSWAPWLNTSTKGEWKYMLIISFFKSRFYFVIVAFYFQEFLVRNYSFSFVLLHMTWTSQVAQWVKNMPAMLWQRRCSFHPWVRKIPWRRAWQLTPVFLPGEFRGLRSLAGYSPWALKRVRQNQIKWACMHIWPNNALTQDCNFFI